MRRNFVDACLRRALQLNEGMPQAAEIRGLLAELRQ
jgi:hypothetical protein